MGISHRHHVETECMGGIRSWDTTRRPHWPLVPQRAGCLRDPTWPVGSSDGHEVDKAEHVDIPPVKRQLLAVLW